MSPKKQRPGRRITVSSLTTPPQYRTAPCPCCGADRQLINGRWLSYLRTKARVDQRELAAKLKVTAPTLSEIENNRRDVSEDIVAAYVALEAS